MRRALTFAIFGALALNALSPSVGAQEGCTTPAMFVFDGSGSMAQSERNHITTPRITEARHAVAEAIPEIAALRDLGLVVYGPGGTDGCSGIDLRFAPRPNAAPAVIEAVNAPTPGGDTAIDTAMRAAVAVLADESTSGTILLLTDGEETCGGAPCDLATQLAATDVTVHVIGFKVRGPFFAWDNLAGSALRPADSNARCLADETGGLYVRTETVDELTAALRETLGCNMLF